MRDAVSPSPLDTHGLCLLSLDGGGVRGLSTLYILKDIMGQLNRERTDRQHLKPCDVFDLIGGTSTGGLIAIMLGRLELDIDDCIAAYSELMHTIFHEKANNVPVDWSGKIRAQYDSRKLKAAIEHVIERAGAGPNDLMDDGTPRRCRTFVCTTSKQTLQIVRLRSYSVDNDDSVPATICEAALATSAATGYFDPVSIGDRQFVDGAFGANNPIEEVEEEAADVWCTTSRNLRPLVKCFLSIGTGCPGQAPLDDKIIKFLSKTLVRMVTKPESTERRFIARWGAEFNEKRYFRFNVQQGLQTVRMAEYHKRSLIESVTHDYLHYSAQKSRIRDCIMNLADKEGRTDLDFDILMNEFQSRLTHARMMKNAPSPQHPFQNTRRAWVVPFERNPRFVDREILGKLRRRLFTGIQPARIGVCGLGGVGKTQIALELAFQTRDMFPDCAILWIPAVDMESLEQAYRKVASELMISYDPEKDDVKRSVQEHLGRPGSGRWLMIFDNADDLSMWTDSLPGSNTSTEGLKRFLPQREQGVILFTTRSAKVAQYLASTDTISIPELDELRATKVLRNCLINKGLLNDRESTLQLLESLTFLPLAIVQAASFMNENGTDISSYLKLLEKQDQDVIELLSDEFEDEGRYRSIRNPVATTWLVSFEQIHRLNSLAAEYLSFMACINAKDVPTCFLRSPSPVEQSKAIGVLSSYSFVKTRNAESRLEMHRLVHLATRNWLRSVNALQSWQIFALQQVTWRFPPYSLLHRSEWRSALPHALHILQQTASEPLSRERTWLLQTVAECVGLDARHQESEKLWIQAVQCSEARFGFESYQNLKNRGFLAHVNLRLGRTEKATKMCEEILDTAERVFGRNTDESMTASIYLATALRSVGQLAKAEQLAAQFVLYQLRARGPYEVITWTGLDELMKGYYQQGRLSDAEKLGGQLLYIATKLFERDDPRIIDATVALANVYMDRWKLKNAENVYREALEKERRILGTDHPAVLLVMYSLANAIKLQRRAPEAVDLLTECVRLSERSQGVSHPDTIYRQQCLERWKSRRLEDRINSRIFQFERSDLMMRRRKCYPRVKVYGGLYKARRQPKDDTIYREVLKAMGESQISRFNSSGGFTLVGVEEEKKRRQG